MKKENRMKEFHAKAVRVVCLAMVEFASSAVGRQYRTGGLPDSV